MIYPICAVLVSLFILAKFTQAVFKIVGAVLRLAWFLIKLPFVIVRICSSTK